MSAVSHEKQKAAALPPRPHELQWFRQLEHFPAKWIPVRRRKCDQAKR
jgi:hypothetical protein